MQSTHHAVGWHRLVVLHEIDTVPKDGRYFLIELSLREALEEVAAGVFEYARLNDEHAGDGCLNYFHKIFCLNYITSVRMRILGERERPWIDRKLLTND